MLTAHDGSGVSELRAAAVRDQDEATLGGAARSLVEKGGGSSSGIKLLLCENPLPPLPEALDAARDALPESNYYTEPFSEPLRQEIGRRLGVSTDLIHVNAGSELILRQLFERFGQRVLLTSPTYRLFPEIAETFTEVLLEPDAGFRLDLNAMRVPDRTTLVVIVNPNNPTGTVVDMRPLPELISEHPRTRFLVDEAFIDLAGESVARLVPEYSNLLVTRTLSKAHSLAGFRVGYAVLPPDIANDLNTHNDAYPLTRPSQAAALATLHHEDAIRGRIKLLRDWTDQLAGELRALGVRTFPTETYFFLADFSPFDADELAVALAERGILVKPLDDARLGPGFMRVTTALPEDNARFVATLRELLARPSAAGTG
jgi:histidinol-phosphate aminotransferase